MVNLKRAAEILYNHFDNVTAVEFVEGLKRSSPELFEQKQETEQILSNCPEIKPAVLNAKVASSSLELSEHFLKKNISSL